MIYYESAELVALRANFRYVSHALFFPVFIDVTPK